MRRNSKSDIRLEVPEQFPIYLMSDVIAQSSASLEFAFVRAKCRPVIEDPPRARSRGTTPISFREEAAWRNRGTEGARIACRSELETLPDSASMPSIPEDRAEMPNDKRL